MHPHPWPTVRASLDRITLPAAFVDRRALRRNVERTLARMVRPDVTMRIATKSIRSVDAIHAILEIGGPRMVGLMCYAAAEAAFLSDRGFDDLLVAYPTVQPAALRAVAERVRRGSSICIVVDCTAHGEALSAAAVFAGTTLDAVIEVDTSWRPAGDRLHVGARRSPVRSVAQAVALGRALRSLPGIRVVGVMGYEAHVAGLPDAVPSSPAMNVAKRAMKRAAEPAARSLRSAIASALRADGHAVRLVNGGGTGSVHLTSADPAVTEVTAGSAFYAPRVFDDFEALSLDPAAFYAVEVSRASDPGFVTCAGGGYVASGSVGPDKAPVAWLPEGLRPIGAEGVGEVQTPLVKPRGCVLAAGDPVLFRHAKAGELCEHFNELNVIDGEQVVASWTTYRGDGQVF